ncbi:MAG: hypothetical protein KJ040_00530 [Gammaproteobacteria bacterium]|nr:hypothetical protein [Gammaproteobacteria bacterium]
MKTELSRSLVALLVSGSLLSAVPLPAHAVTLLTIWGGASLEDDAGDTFGDSFSQQAATGPLAYSTSGVIQAQDASTAGTISVRSKANFGVLGAESTVVLFAPQFGNRHNGTGNSEAFFYDDITITPNDSSLLGQPGVLRGVLHLTGHLVVTVENVPVLPPNFSASTMSSAWDATIQLSNAHSIFGSERWFAQGQVLNGAPPVYTGPTAPTDLIFELPFVLGSTAQLSVGLFVQSSGIAVSGRGDVSGSVALFDTLGWGGITAITTADGTPVDYQLTSGSGVDWTQSAVAPVPLPGSAWLLITGVAALAARAGRRRAAKLN